MPFNSNDFEYSFFGQIQEEKNTQITKSSKHTQGSLDEKKKQHQWEYKKVFRGRKTYENGLTKEIHFKLYYRRKNKQR